MCDSDKKDPDRLHCVTKVCDKKGKEKNPTNHTGFSIILTVGKILPTQQESKTDPPSSDRFGSRTLRKYLSKLYFAFL